MRTTPTTRGPQVTASSQPAPLHRESSSPSSASLRPAPSRFARQCVGRAQLVMSFVVKLAQAAPRKTTR